MKYVRGGTIKFDPVKMVEMFSNEFFVTGQAVARRMEQEAKQFLAERTGETSNAEFPSKSSGALANSVQGFVRAGIGNSIEVGVTASAIETGQWESEQGEPEEAAFTRGAGDFDYAAAVESGSGAKAINPVEKIIKQTYWKGSYLAGDVPDIARIKPSIFKGQKGKFFLRDAVRSSGPAIRRLLKDIGNNIRVTEFIRWEN
jgi:hypothetical protein